MPTELSGNHGENLFPNEVEDLYILEQNVANNDFSSIPVFPDFHTDSHDPSLYPADYNVQLDINHLSDLAYWPTSGSFQELYQQSSDQSSTLIHDHTPIVLFPSSPTTTIQNCNSMNENGLLDITMDSETLPQAQNSKAQRDSLNIRSPSLNQDTPLSTPTNNRRNHRNRQIFACMNAECKNRRFSDQACLNRHLREKHGSKMHYCPIPTCNGSRKGFARKSNLLAHKRRCHPNAFSKLLPDNLFNPTDENTQSELVESGVSEVGQSGGDGCLGRKLRDELIEDHQADLENIDREIGILEGALAIMRDDGDGEEKNMLEAQ